MLISRWFAAARRSVAALELSLSALCALLAGLLALAVSSVVFGAATEDVTQHNGLALHDATRLRLFVDHRDAFVVHAAKIATDVGSVPIIFAIAVGAGALLWWRGQRLAIALAPAFALGLSATAAGVVKVLVGRSRPPVGLHLVAESDASFPSGHATNSTAVFVTIALVVAVFVLRRPLTRVLAVAGAALASASVGASRLVLGVHWPSDVIAGLALGGAVALAVTMTAAIVTRLAPRPPSHNDGRVRRMAFRTQGWLAIERPSGDLRAA
jgi:undecaprenyl-diphosphatase